MFSGQRHGRVASYFGALLSFLIALMQLSCVFIQIKERADSPPDRSDPTIGISTWNSVEKVRCFCVFLDQRHGRVTDGQIWSETLNFDVAICREGALTLSPSCGRASSIQAHSLDLALTSEIKLESSFTSCTTSILATSLREKRCFC